MTPVSFSKNNSLHATLRELLSLGLLNPAVNQLDLREDLQQAAAAPGGCQLSRLSGGEISQVYRLRLPGGASLLFKWHGKPPVGFFEAEARGLAALAAPRSLRIPRVLATHRNGILMEWLERRGPASPPAGARSRENSPTGPIGGRKPPADPGEALGQGLAAIHRTTAGAYGFDHDNFVGLLPQPNGWSESWISFYRERRLVPQLEIAARLGRLTPERRTLSERLLDRLPRWIDDTAVRPALVHGDLWHGNWLDTVDGPALIDPAAYYGDREMDLAMASLFGGFSEAFWRAYEEAYPLLPGHEERRPLYQLYYLLIHLNIFGEQYGPGVDRILRAYGR